MPMDWQECDQSDPEGKFIWEEPVNLIYDWDGNLMILTLLEINFTGFAEAILIVSDSFSIINKGICRYRSSS